jgi:hypothetical protein
MAAAITALGTPGPCESYNTGFYGAQAMKWFMTYPLVPGLGHVIGQNGRDRCSWERLRVGVWMGRYLDHRSLRRS